MTPAGSLMFYIDSGYPDGTMMYPGAEIDPAAPGSLH